ncbi:MAG: 2-hydroxyglutaryl-CoA dehydratase [Syntrophothermus sp.]|uniref:acyl-CoA dehydratase activase n=1 Tax=Syntrophothermus sp. TaxID=2736299 RepID=UPI00257A9FEC|nr:acyl-CoA dehydratase activase [Syntrophothermus sp.]NSW82804.1 2-hydroxyglutaryl-CoA dehydratase [Syntrophothermus sp.]
MESSQDAINMDKGHDVREGAYVLGVDSGSLTAKAVIMNRDREIVAHSVVQLEIVSLEAVKEAVNNVLSSAGLDMSDIAYVVATGYGRRRYDFADKTVTEISCHAKGAHYLFPEVRTVIDIGGQDSKVIAVDEEGNPTHFAMNDRCAAGTGRFLEVMASALRVPLEAIGEMSLKARQKLTISSICTVFAETEVISLVAEGHSKEDILGALHASIASRIAGLVARVGLREPVMMTGGVAKNVGAVRAIERELGVSMTVAKDPQIVGALGAALFALDFVEGMSGLKLR